MFSAFLRSFRKSRSLRNISLRLAPPSDWLEQIAQGTYDYARADQAKDELFDLCETDSDLSKVLQRHCANRKTLDEVYRKLVNVGAGQFVHGHFVAASALAFGFTLDYVLAHKDDEDFESVAWNVLQYFRQDKIGQVK